MCASCRRLAPRLHSPPARLPEPSHLPRVPCLTEASVSLLLGLATGGAYAAVYWARGVPLPSSVLSLDTQFFFDVLLLPILFQAGFSVKKKVRACRQAGALPQPSQSHDCWLARMRHKRRCTNPLRPAPCPPAAPRPSSATSRCSPCLAWPAPSSQRGSLLSVRTQNKKAAGVVWECRCGSALYDSQALGC